MSEQRCECGHVETIHRRNLDLDGRNECWALTVDQVAGRWCQCRQFVAAGVAEQPSDAQREGATNA